MRVKGNDDPWGGVYKVCVRKRRFVDSIGIKFGERVSKMWRESVNGLLNVFFPSGDACVNENEETVESRDPNFMNEFNFSEIGAAVRANKSDKVPGMDGITARKNVQRMV